MNEVQEKSVVSYEELTTDLTELVNEIYTLATPVLKAVSFYKERVDGQVQESEKLRLQSDLLGKVEQMDVYDVLDAIDGIEVLTRALNHFVNSSVGAYESSKF